jgi:hypothetical protein
MAITIICSGCDKKLRVGKRPEAGKKVKCPGCGNAFVPDIEDDDEAASIQEGPRLRSRSASSPFNRGDEDDDTPVRNRRRDEDDDDAPARKRRRDEDDDPPARKQKRKQKAASNLVLFGLIGVGTVVLLLACGGVGVTAFVWPGFMLSKKAGDVVKGAAARDAPEEKALTSYLLPNADLVLGVSARGLRESGQFESILNWIQSTQQQALPREATEVFRECDKALLSMHANALANQGGPKGNQGGPPGQPRGGPNGPPNGPFGAQPKIVLAVLMSNAAGMSKAKNQIRAAQGVGAEERLAGRYPLMRQREQNGQIVLYAFPTERTLVITASPVTDQDLTSILDKAARNEAAAVPAQVAKMMPMVEQAHFWIAYAADAQARGALGMLPLFLGNQKGVPPAVQAMTQALGKVKGASLGVDAVPGGGMKLQLHVECDDANAARSLKDGGEALKGMLINQAAQDPTAPRSLVQDLNTLTFAAQGTTASGRVSFSAATMNGMNGRLPRMGGPPNQGFGPPKNFQPGPPQGGRPKGAFHLEKERLNDRAAEAFHAEVIQMITVGSGPFLGGCRQGREP